VLGCKGGSERPTVDAIALYLMCLQAQVYPHLSLPPHLIGGKVKVLLTSLDFTSPKGRYVKYLPSPQSVSCVYSTPVPIHMKVKDN